MGGGGEGDGGGEEGFGGVGQRQKTIKNNAKEIQNKFKSNSKTPAADGGRYNGNGQANSKILLNLKLRRYCEVWLS